MKETSIQNYKFATLRCDTIIGIYEKANLPCKMVQALAKKSTFLSSRNLPVEAMTTLIEADKLIKISNCSNSDKATIYLAYIGVYDNQKDHVKADSMARVGLSIWKPIPGEISTGIKLYFSLADENDLESAVLMNEKALKLAETYNLFDLQLTAIINIGYVYAYNDDFPKASTYFKMALPLANKRNAYKEIGTLYNNLAGLSDDLKMQGIYVDSALYFATKRNNLEDMLTFTENKSLFLKNNKEYEAAFNELWTAMSLKDSVFTQKRVEAIADMQEKYESEKQANTIQKLKLDKLDAEVKALTYKRTQLILILGSLFLVIIAGFMTYSFLNVKKNRNQLAIKNLEIEAAREASDHLLLNILPEEVANELKANGSSKSRQFDQVSILFTDFVDFTKITEELGPVELVDELNMCFKTFDLILEKYNIEKIKTIGDAYMAAGNIPAPIEHCAMNTVLAALEMQKFILERHLERTEANLPAFEMRVGINVGTVVAGIVGLKKFQYDIWGDTVNTAARLESEGIGGKVNISASTFELIKHEPIFEFEFRGRVQAKGKGQIDMYFVTLKSDVTV